LVKTYAPAEFPTGAQQAHHFARELRAGGVDVRVVTTNGNGANALDVATGRWTERDGVPVYYGLRIPRTSDLSWDAWRSFHRESRAADVIHVMGMFSWINLAAASAARRCGVPVVVSPRGMLNPEALAFSRRKKALYFRLGGSRALDETAGFHVTSEKERDNVAKLRPRARIAVIPNGVVVPSDDDLASFGPDRGDPTVLFVGRIHPIKNVIPLVRAWASIVPRYPRAKLVLAGPDDHGHRAEVERTIASLGIGASVVLPGYVGGADLGRLLVSSACLVLPSVAENFGNVVAEALAHRLPVVASTGTPWSELRDRGCGWWIEPSVERLEGAIEAALSLTPEERVVMGDRARRWMTEAFSWSSFASRMAELYRGVLASRTARP